MPKILGWLGFSTGVRSDGFKRYLFPTIQNGWVVPANDDPDVRRATDDDYRSESEGY
jgi:hypothetical protein